jgi:hypothetical protein
MHQHPGFDSADDDFVPEHTEDAVEIRGGILQHDPVYAGSPQGQEELVHVAVSHEDHPPAPLLCRAPQLLMRGKM